MHNFMEGDYEVAEIFKIMAEYRVWLPPLGHNCFEKEGAWY